MADANAKKRSRILFPVIGLIGAVIAVSVLVVTLVIPKQQAKKQLTTVTSHLEKTLELSDLETAQIFYNAVAAKTDETGENIQYYAAYEGMIKAGIDFSGIHIVPETEGETTTITVTLPSAEILEYTVNPGTIEYIFLDKKAETESVAAEAYKICLEDLKNRASEDMERLLTAAYENAKNAVEGLSRPWLEQMGQGYNLVIK